MLTENKVLKLFVPFQKSSENEDGSVTITGRASTNDTDRQGDIIISDAWKDKAALANYLKNPIILAFHDGSKPIGKTISHEIDDKGLTITAKISKAAGNIIDLIKEGILTSFSVGFIMKDADFDPKSGIFAIKALELLEVSVVSIPANQNALFSIEKNFSNPSEYKEFRNKFIESNEEKLMTIDNPKSDGAAQPIDIAALAAQITSMVKGNLDADKLAKEAKDAADTAALTRIETTAKTAAASLVAQLREELVTKDAEVTDVLLSIKEALKQGLDKRDLEAELKGDRKGKHEFAENNPVKLTTNQKDGMLYASKILGIPIQETRLYKELAKKSGMEHWDSGVGEWEDEYSTRVENALREQLVVEPLFMTIPMTTPTLTMPINPDAGDATWVHSAAYRTSGNPSDETGDGTDTSTGTAQDHTLGEQTLIAYKLATREYVGYEEEEDSIVALAPIINDAVARRMARASDLSFLRGAGVLSNSSSYDPITGLVNRGSGTDDVSIIGGAGYGTNVSEDDIATMRRNLGLYGLDPTKLVLIVSHDYYYELMKLANFKTMDVMGNAATILTGQVGSIFGVPVKVSQMFDNTAITDGDVGTVLACMTYTNNFVKGILRGITTESAQDVINQKRVIVSSRRFAFQDVIAGEGTVNLTINS